jgi:hypothetical protein
MFNALVLINKKLSGISVNNFLNENYFLILTLYIVFFIVNITTFILVYDRRKYLLKKVKILNK